MKQRIIESTSRAIDTLSYYRSVDRLHAHFTSDHARRIIETSLYSNFNRTSELLRDALHDHINYNLKQKDNNND